jgi:hypothetical protein
MVPLAIVVKALIARPELTREHITKGGRYWLKCFLLLELFRLEDCKHNSLPYM